MIREGGAGRRAGGGKVDDDGDDRPARDAAGVEQRLREFLEAVDAGDGGGLARCFEPDATAYFPFRDPAQLVRGREAIVARFEALFGTWARQGRSPPYVGLRPGELQLQPAGTDHVLATFVLDIAGSTGRRTVLLRQATEGWRIRHLHASNVQATPAAMHPPAGGSRKVG